MIQIRASWRAPFCFFARLLLDRCCIANPGLINGAAGGVGTFAVRIAKLFGANVTGVCSTSNVDMIRAVRADYAEPEPLRQLLVTAELILARQIRHYSRVAAALSF